MPPGPGRRSTGATNWWAGSSSPISGGYAKSERYFENDPAREVSKQGAAGRASKCIARRALSELNAILAPSWRRQERRLTRIELHVEGGEKCCRPGVIAHEGDEVDQSTAAELP